MVVEDQLDGGVGRVGFIEPLEEADELARAVAVLDTGMNLAAQQIDPGQQAQRSVPLVFMVACEARVNPRLRRQIGGGVADRLDPSLPR